MLEIKNITKAFHKFNLTDISFGLEQGDYFALLGPSGSGKSVLLEIISGLQQADSGEIILNWKNITREKIQHREVGILFQDFAVFPHMTVRENIAYPLKMRKYAANIINKRVEYLAQQLSITNLLDKNTTILSGGETQRVALARTLAIAPKVLLLDEPLASLDVILRNELRTLLRNINRNGQTIIHVTHDYEEVVSLANKVAIIQNGKIIQSGNPKEVLHNPKNEFIANFSGIKNFFSVYIYFDESESVSKAKIGENLEISLHTNDANINGHIVIDSENIFISEEKINSSAINNFWGTITDIFPTRLGIEVVVDIGVEFYVVVTKASSLKLELNTGKKIWISFKASSVKFIKN